ncbi:hypothetical protein ACFL0Q_03810, partial [Thermodesulfobacteriota bacterium]
LENMFEQDFSDVGNRKKRKALNLWLGLSVTQILAEKKTNLKRAVHDFYRKWHRDFAEEFFTNSQGVSSPSR